MRRLILVGLVVGLLIGADDPQKDKGKKGATALEGTWVVVSVTRDGKETDRANGNKLVVKGKTMTGQTKDGERKGAVTFTADPKQHTLDFTYTEGKNKGQTHGIYSLKGDGLKICMADPGKDRPKDFTAGKGSGHTLVVLKRPRVTGTVTLDGKPLANAFLLFHPVKKGGQEATARTEEDGTFHLTTPGKKGRVLPGNYRVTISILPTKNDANDDKRRGGHHWPKRSVPRRYWFPNTTPLKVTVKEGRNQFDLQLRSR
jgi:uncharacterized protein (TIGR03067 family)